MGTMIQMNGLNESKGLNIPRMGIAAQSALTYGSNGRHNAYENK